MTAKDKSHRFCKVQIKGRRSIVLDHFTLADGVYVSGITPDGERLTLKLRDGVRVTPLASDCEGELVPAKVACRCNRTAALAHDVAQNPLPPMPPKPQVLVASKSVNSFAALSTIVKGGR
jgi:hypothetical protein